MARGPLFLVFFTESIDTHPQRLQAELVTVMTSTNPDAVQKARAELQIARTITLTRAPYIGPMLSKLIIVWKPGLGTFGVTERGHLLIDPVALLKWAGEETIDAIAGVLFHEVMHVVLAHCRRVEQRDPKRWNVAADLYINGVATECGLRLPSCGIFPITVEHRSGKAPWATPTEWTYPDGSKMALPAGKTADEYYDLLPEGAEGNEGPAGGACGSGAGGEALDGEPVPGESDDDGEIPARSEGELAQAAEAVARQVQEHARKTAGKGVSPALAVWADAATRPPVVPWNRKLRRAGRIATDRAGGGRQSYRRPHRRAVCLGNHPRNPLMPIHEQTTCRVWYVQDTSASMGVSDQVAAVSELMGVTRHGGEVSILSCDTQVHGEPRKLPKSPSVVRRMITDLLAGGGGTDFRPAFELAESMPKSRRPDLIVFATDGYGPAPASTTIPTIWLITPGGKAPADYGEVILLPRV